MRATPLASSGQRKRAAGRSVAWVLPFALAALLAVPSAASAGSTHTWSAPFHGKFSHSGSSATGQCAGAANDTSRLAPTFNASTGVVHLLLEANVSGGQCGALDTFAKISSEFSFTTSNFSVSAGFHHIAITWSLKWFADLTTTGGRAGHALPASASYELGVNGANLCNMVNRTCTPFPNSSARGPGGANAWSVGATATGTNVTAFKSTTVTVYLNTTFSGHTKYRLSTSMFATASARSHLTGHAARAYLLMLPVLGGYARLVGLSVS
ncbi:MAG TPA: hypothetical protein VMH90_04200 [Thermoplasmata archaeon]|nr:hypothetical protein [Thermoplasmata archaeon]